ncbi:hypothetical protein [Pseudarthrobacter sp. LT1]|uniref:hypothetical protein n=1 Tax=Pseudarthrobacter sp. LT1 TaxID=3111450 RepID=UPI002D7662EE|nr:hypothetical protein [Pseudarthrobacter sp. LT1]WRT13655.1 hypothetical protein VIK36_20315 [Pseudarthrobacter sp. LT1]
MSDHLAYFFLRCFEADLYTFEFAQPAAIFGFYLPYPKGFYKFFEPGSLCWIGAQHGASDAGMFVYARSPIGPSATAEFNLSLFEVLVKLADFGVCRFDVIIGRPHRRAPVEETAEVPEPRNPADTAPHWELALRQRLTLPSTAKLARL